MSLPRNKKFRPLVAILSILAVIALSMLGVTLSAYIKQINLFGDGWVGPKYFAFEIDSTGDTKSMAPGESVDYVFHIRNYNEEGTSQVDLRVSIEIEYPGQLAGTGRDQGGALPRWSADHIRYRFRYPGLIRQNPA